MSIFRFNDLLEGFTELSKVVILTVYYKMNVSDENDQREKTYRAVSRRNQA